MPYRIHRGLPLAAALVLSCVSWTSVAEAAAPPPGVGPGSDPAAARDTSHAGPVEIGPGSGSFLVSGENGYGEKSIRVFYHRPETLAPDSPVLLVVPGAGRNGDDYRDAWVEASEQHGVLVLSPHYSERHYPEYWSYNLAGMTSRATFEVIVEVDTRPEGEWRLDDTAAALDSALAVHPHELFGHGSFGRLLQQMVLLNTAGMVADVDPSAAGVEVNSNRAEWIFDDFDRIFRLATEELGLQAESYDAFGHSAGGQILHRLALFHPDSRADRILAANSGWYTLPSIETRFPYGLGGTPVDEEGLAEALDQRLVVFLGEEDDADETRGSLRTGPEVDEQGPGRLSRGKYFYGRGRNAADEFGTALNWKLHVVAGVGHDYRRMSEAAAMYLYGGDDSE